MKTRNLLKEYISRLIHQTLVQVTGGLGFVLTAMLEIFFPGVFIKWVFYLIILVAGLIVGSYFVFVDLIKEYEVKENEYKHAVSELELKISKLENTQPRIVVGFQDNAHHLVKKLQLHLSPLPPKPDFDALPDLVEEKRRELLAKRPSSRSIQDSLAAIASAPFNEVNPNYEKEVEQYLVKYGDFLVRAYECTVDRAYPICPIVENRGHYPASSVTIEFEMPAGYKKPDEHQCFDRSAISSEELDFYLVPPYEPKPFISRLDALRNIRLPDLSGSILAQIESNINGPIHEERDGIHYIAYTIGKLIQHRPEADFEPFWLWLADIDHSTVWEIPVKITSADLRKAQEEILLLEIKAPESSFKTGSSE